MLIGILLVVLAVIAVAVFALLLWKPHRELDEFSPSVDAPPATTQRASASPPAASAVPAPLSHPPVSLASPSQEQTTRAITAARVGDKVSIRGAGQAYGDCEFTVQRLHRYEAGGEEWFELIGEDRGRKVSLEVFEDDAVEVEAVFGDAGLSLADIGLTEDDLIRMDDQESRSNFIEYDGHRWMYDSSEEVFFCGDGDGDGEGFYCWEFSEETGERILSIEKWEDEPFEACIAALINPADISVSRA